MTSASFGRKAVAAAAALVLWAADPGMVAIPAADFQRGRTFPWIDAELPYTPTAFRDDQPVRTIHLDAFLLDASEVTNEQYAKFVSAAKHRPPYHWIDGRMPADKASHPVVNVSWDDAAAFCAWSGKRLPTEAEWERACRGGTESRMFPWGDDNPGPKLAHFESTDTSSVCAKQRNALGLCDMSGNVWEWTADWYDRTYYGAAPASNPPGPAQGTYRVLRGGSWFDTGKLFLTCSYRSWARPPERSPTIGFRCAKDVPAQHTSNPR
jgi:formylglycine-generating enzyme required for sulfatase activity